MKKRKRNRAERTRKKRARREEKRQMKGTMTMAEKKIIMAEQIHAYVKKEKYAEAINAFADVLAQGEPPKECYADVARAYFELGDYKLAVLTKYRTAHEKSKVFEKQALRRVWQIRSYPVLHLYFLCAHPFRIQILP